MMTKKQANDFLVDYLNGFGSDEEREQVQEWLEKDAELSNEAEMLRNEMSLLNGMLEDPFEGARLTAVTDIVMSKVRDKRQKGLAQLSPAWRSYLRGAAFAALAVVVVAVIYFITPGIFVSDQSQIPYAEELGIHPQDDGFTEKIEWDFKNTPHENYPLLLHYHPLVIYRHNVIKQADVILLMEQYQKDIILKRYPKAAGKVFLLMEYLWNGEDKEIRDIPDPTGQDLVDYEEFMEVAHTEVDRIFRELGREGIL